MNALTTLNQSAWSTDFQSLALVWLGLYTITLLTFGFVFIQVARQKLAERLILPFSLNLIFNLAFGPLEATTTRHWIPALDLAAVAITLLWAMIIIAPRYRWISLAQIPYLLWVSLAMLLQFQLIFNR